MKKHYLRIVFGMITMCIFLMGCAAEESQAKPELTIEEKIQLIQEKGLRVYMQEYPIESEEDFWALAEEACPLTPFQDIVDKKVQEEDILVNAVVAYKKEGYIGEHGEEYTLALLYELADGSYAPYKEELDLKDAEREYEYFAFGSDTIRNLEKDDTVVLCCNPSKRNSVWDEHIYAIKKTGHKEGFVDQLIREYEEEQTAIAATAESASSGITLTPQQILETYIESHVRDNYSKTTVDKVAINEDMGTDAEGDYIALVNLTWDVQNSPETTEKMLQMYSDDLAASLAIDHPEVQEVAIFWQVPYLGSNTSKWSYERRNGGMYATDKVLGF